MTKACIYLRLSRDDGDNVESNSIINQRSLLRDYARNHNFTILEEFVDDGISGLIFNRPDFNRMMAMVNDKVIDTIIVKDLSRFGRDYIETGKYLQRIFPAMGVRFISVTIVTVETFQQKFEAPKKLNGKRASLLELLPLMAIAKMTSNGII